MNKNDIIKKINEINEYLRINDGEIEILNDDAYYFIYEMSFEQLKKIFDEILIKKEMTLKEAIVFIEENVDESLAGDLIIYLVDEIGDENEKMK